MMGVFDSVIYAGAIIILRHRLRPDGERVSLTSPK
jgi:hypothetical protein